MDQLSYCQQCHKFYVNEKQVKTTLAEATPVRLFVCAGCADDFMKRYFFRSEEYPDPVALMMDYGVMLSYISQTFLEGWINYVTIDRAWLVDRYTTEEEPGRNARDAAAFNADPGVHTSIGRAVADDVLILARAKEPTEWWFFWFDRDVSDCMIGRFLTDDPPDEVRRRFDDYVTRCHTDGKVGVHALNAANFRGWISF